MNIRKPVKLRLTFTLFKDIFHMQTEILAMFKYRLSDLIDLILIVMVYTNLTPSRVKTMLQAIP